MLATSGTVFDDNNYLFEIKWDGMRMLAFLEPVGHHLVNRHGIDATARYSRPDGVCGSPPCVFH